MIPLAVVTFTKTMSRLTIVPIPPDPLSRRNRDRDRECLDVDDFHREPRGKRNLIKNIISNMLAWHLFFFFFFFFFFWKRKEDFTMKLKGLSICMPVAHEFEDLELLYPLPAVRRRRADHHRLLSGQLQCPSLCWKHQAHHRPAGLPGAAGAHGGGPPFRGGRHDGHEAGGLRCGGDSRRLLPGHPPPRALHRRFRPPAPTPLGKPIAAICHAPWLPISARSSGAAGSPAGSV